MRFSSVAVCFAALTLSTGALAQGPVVVLETSKGKIEIEVDDKKAPKSAENFLKYVDDGYYNGTIFHRVIKKFMVQGGGCAGLKYGMALELQAQPDDAVVEAGEVKVLIDPESQPHLEGTTIDFVSGLEGSGFVFNNPNASSSCGCGKSFC